MSNSNNNSNSEGKQAPEQQVRRVVSAPDLRELDASAPNHTNEHRRRRASISFGMIEVRSYEVVRGHPEIEMAHPLSLGWNSVQSQAISVDDYETTRAPRRATHRNMLRTNSEERRQRIKESAGQHKGSTSSSSSLPSFLRLLPKQALLLTVGRCSKWMS